MREGSVSNLIVAGILIFAITFSGFVRESKSEGDNGEPVSEKGPHDCMRLMLRAGKRLMKMFSPCSRVVKANSTSNKDFADKMGCVMKCVMVNVNMTSVDQLVTPDSLKFMVKQFLPNEFMINEVHSFLMTSCGQIASKLDPNEEKCLTYADYITCLQAGFEEFMNNSPYCMKRKKKTSPSDN